MIGFVLQDGRSPLFTSSLNGYLGVVKALIGAKAIINQANKVSAHIPTRASLLFKVTKLHRHVGQPGL